MKTKIDSTAITFKLAIASVFAALVFVATIFFTVSIPATGGYFNVGETVIYVAALLFGPFVGAFAGGVGAAIADMMVAAEFAPGTLVIKSCEGAIVGFLNRKMFRQTSRSNWRIFTAILGAIVGVLLAATGSINYSGDVVLNFGSFTLAGYVQPEIWYFLGAVVALLIILMGIKIEPESGRAILSMIIGGLEMVAGYFIYEQLILTRTTALAEIPANIGQMIVGLVVAIPIAKIVLRSLPQLKSQNPIKS
jgi:uncharacterized membrane protein